MRNGARSKGRLSRLLLAGALWAAAAPSQAEIQVLPGMATDVDQATVEAVLTTFRQADDAMTAGTWTASWRSMRSSTITTA